MPEPLLQVRDLSKTFHRNGVKLRAVDGVSFDLGWGETLALAGPSGSGKSTVARLVMRLLEPDSGAITLGDDNLLGTSGEPLRRLRRRFQMVFQDTTASFNPRAAVGEVLSDPLRIHQVVPEPERPDRIDRLLERVGLDPKLAGRAIHEVSGGQRQRIAIARALASEPDLIVLDEALSAVDSSVRGEIVKLLVEQQRWSGTSFLFISHDLALVRAMAHRVAIMEAGRIVEIGPSPGVIGNPQSEVGRALVAATSRLVKAATKAENP